MAGPLISLSDSPGYSPMSPAAEARDTGSSSAAAEGSKDASSSSASPVASSPCDALSAVPTAVATFPSHYGRMDPDDENSLELLESVSDDGSLKRRGKLPAMLSLQEPCSYAGSSDQQHHDVIMQGANDTMLRHGKSSGTAQQREQSPTKSKHPPFFTIPPELIDTILSHLSAYDLVRISATCHLLRKHAASEFHWQRCIQQNLPNLKITNPGPCANFRDLYAAHDCLWFLPKYKIWFCDRDLTGKLIVARYDPRRGCIEGYQLVAVSNMSTLEQWSVDQNVVIHSFEPQVKLHLDKPVLQFRVQDRQERESLAKRPGANRFADEMPMALDDRLAGMYSNFLLTRPLDPVEADRRLALDYPYDNIWPPPVIPAHHHVSGARSGQAVIENPSDDRPRYRSQVSDQTFRIRQWMELAGTPAPPGLMGQAGFAATIQVLAGGNAQGNAVGAGTLGVHIGEEVVTYSTLDPMIHTPTPTKPWRGIWVGDYSLHGCEFLLLNQPDDPPASDEELGLVREEDESDEAWENRKLDARIYRGRLEAIKLTGDPNVPRGEYTFVADDLGPSGYVGVVTDAPFAGARVVRSKGHVAATGFLRDKFIESQLILISPNRLAQYWVGFGHISFFERVDIDQFLTP